MDKDAQLRRFYHDHLLQVWLYTFMYVDPDTIPVEDNFPATKQFVLDYKKISTPGTVPKYCLGFSYIRSEYYDLDMNFNEKK